MYNIVKKTHETVAVIRFCDDAQYTEQDDYMTIIEKAKDDNSYPCVLIRSEHCDILGYIAHNSIDHLIEALQMAKKEWGEL